MTKSENTLLRDIQKDINFLLLVSCTYACFSRIPCKGAKLRSDKKKPIYYKSQLATFGLLRTKKLSRDILSNQSK